MATQNININFAQGLNLKTDPFQLPIGEFLQLENSVFTTGNLLSKRSGYGFLDSAAAGTTYLTTYNDSLISIGDQIQIKSPSLEGFISKGNLQTCSLAVNPLVRNNYNQVAQDSAQASGLVCTVYSQAIDDVPNLEFYYTIEDSETFQTIVSSTALPTLPGTTVNGTSRVFVVDRFFVIVSPVIDGSMNVFLQYVSIPLLNPTSVSIAQNVTSEVYVSTSGNPGWDGCVSLNQDLVIAYNTTTGGQGVHVTFLASAQIAAGQASAVIHSFVTTTDAGLLSLCSDQTQGVELFYLTFWTPMDLAAYTAAVYLGFGSITVQFEPAYAGSFAITNLASAAQNGSAFIFVQGTNVYSYDTSIRTDLIGVYSIDSSGTPSSVIESTRSLGLASKAFIVQGVIYYLGVYQSPYQSTYFLINATLSGESLPRILAKVAYSNAGGYLALGLPGVTVSGNQAFISYLYKQNVQSLTVQSDTSQTPVAAIYSQLGVNLATFEFGTERIQSSEIADNLHLSGGYLTMFDGNDPVEHNFFLFPDSVEALWSETGGSIAAQPDGSTNTAVYSYLVTYEWTDAKGNAFRSAPSIAFQCSTTGSGTTGSFSVYVPTLRLTAKTQNPLKIVIYRWSIAQQVYHQVTSISAPISNDLTTDSITYMDTLSDAEISANNLIYTTGGVVPDTNAPATNLMTVFDTRLCLVSAEDPNLLWISKTVIEQTPVEMSSFFTIYISPNTGTTQSTGPITALSPMDDKLILFKKNAIFYITGTGPDNLGTTSNGCPLGNYSPPIFCTSIVGCVNQKSLVLTPNGMMFQSDKGIWLLRRDLQTQYVGAAVETYNSAAVTSAQVIPGTNYVLFTLDEGTILMYDYYYNQWGTWRGPGVVLSSCIYQGEHTLLTSYAQVLQQHDDTYLDHTHPVLMAFTTAWINLASLQGYQRFYEFYLLGNFISPHFLQLNVGYDYNPSFSHSTLIAPQNFSPSYPSSFGVPTPVGSPSPVEQWRIHAKRQLCESFQIQIQEVYDPTQDPNAAPGAGLTLSGMNCKIEVKRGTRPIRGSLTAG